MGRISRRNKQRKDELGQGVVDVLVTYDKDTRRPHEISFSIVAKQYEYTLTLGPNEYERLRQLLAKEKPPPPNPGI